MGHFSHLQHEVPRSLHLVMQQAQGVYGTRECTSWGLLGRLVIVAQTVNQGVFGGGLVSDRISALSASVCGEGVVCSSRARASQQRR